MEALLSKITDLPYEKYFSFLSPLWTPRGIFAFVMVMAWITYLWETYLKYRQYSLARKTTCVPLELAGVMDHETYNKARNYQMDKTKFTFICTLWEQIFQTVVLLFNGIPFLWAVSGSITARFGYRQEHEITQTVVFSLLGSVLNTLIDLPFSIYDTFVLESKYGFNKETPAFFIKDKIKKFIVYEAVLLPILACIIHIVKIGGDYFFIYVWLFCVIVTLILATIYADYIAPLFDKFTPLPEGELREEIEKLAASISFPLKKLYIVEGSKRSAHSNAYYYGFFNNKRIVLFDTLLQEVKKEEELPLPSDDEALLKEENETNENEKKTDTGCNNDEIVAILAHELGHWKLNHVLKNMIISQVNLFLCFAVFALLFKNSTLYKSFGFMYQKPVIIGLLIIFQYIFSPYHEVISFLVTALNRRFEFQADSFAKILHKATDLRSALIKLNKDNLTFPVYDWLFSAWHHSHPPLLQRIKALGKID